MFYKNYFSGLKKIGGFDQNQQVSYHDEDQRRRRVGRQVSEDQREIKKKKYL